MINGGRPGLLTGPGRIRPARSRSRRVGDWRGSVRHGPFPVPARQTVRAVLPHTAYRRSSPTAFGLPTPVPEGSGRNDGSIEADQAHPVGRQEHLLVAAHLLPRPVQPVPAGDLVEQRMEPSARVGLGRPVQRMLQGSDPVAPDSGKGGPSRNGTHPIPPTAHAQAKQRPFPHRRLCCPAARAVRRPPPTPSRHPAHFPVPHRLSDGAVRACPQHASAGEGLPSSRRHLPSVPRPLTPGSPSRLHLQVFTASMAFAVNRPARLSLDI
jgi:hypothetical protein